MHAMAKQRPNFGIGNLTRPKKGKPGCHSKAPTLLLPLFLLSVAKPPLVLTRVSTGVTLAPRLDLISLPFRSAVHYFHPFRPDMENRLDHGAHPSSACKRENP